MGRDGITYPPEMLPKNEDDEPAEVIVIEPDGSQWTVPPPAPTVPYDDEGRSEKER